MPLLRPNFKHHVTVVSSRIICLKQIFYNLPSFFIYHTHADFDMIPAVRRVHVIHEPCKWPSSLQVSRSSVVRASDRCTEGHRFNSCRGLRFFSLSHAHDMLISLPSLKFTFFYLSQV